MSDDKELRLVRHQFKAEPIDIYFLPKTIQMFAAVIGEREAMRISVFASGREKRLSIYFPDTPGENHVLRGVISDESLEALCDTFCRETFVLSFQINAKRGSTSKQIQQAVRNGLSPREIAKDLGINISKVYRELNTIFPASADRSEGYFTSLWW